MSGSRIFPPSRFAGCPGPAAGRLHEANCRGPSKQPMRGGDRKGHRVIAFSTAGKSWQSDGSGKDATASSKAFVRLILHGQDAPEDFPEVNLCMVGLLEISICNCKQLAVGTIRSWPDFHLILTQRLIAHRGFLASFSCDDWPLPSKHFAVRFGCLLATTVAPA